MLFIPFVSLVAGWAVSWFMVVLTRRPWVAYMAVSAVTIGLAYRVMGFGLAFAREPVEFGEFVLLVSMMSGALLIFSLLGGWISVREWRRRTRA
ncbi:hypothetical protein KRR38_02285 [Novosphingobium sp. G106]|uniref:hypothetical protein n=1 Tax=Novosphingobium sp. G106 TaxID=2849500 RepID=UPI001C2DDF2E|nr:hypothetical protein [Novosphingobium sp. G106]MBV1686524.1 hypothetical protein [Novosphingobium sp. G106]